MVEKIKSALYTHALVDEMSMTKTEISRLNDSIDAKDKIIEEQQVRVSKFDVGVNVTEQYSRRTNVRIQGNETMKMHPPLSDKDVERCHRLGHQDTQIFMHILPQQTCTVTTFCINQLFNCISLVAPMRATVKSL